MRNALPMLALAAMLASCATGPTLSTADRLALYRQNAGPPTATFRLERMTGVQNWTPLGDQALAVWTTANRGALLEMRNRCSGLAVASRITITNRMGLVTARFDSVVPRIAGGSPAPGSACRIETIRPLDASRLRDARREMREAEYVERPADAETPESPPSGTPTP
ncbi:MULTISPECIES: DUF6491 family protein [unclassified Lysobacter]|uniref:DUF6491 family protein n=1 Tax=unclassified Lysobacter TaxID=2635362 RepID=UPI001C23CBB0|nr:DUF6491 family protein [Lysobacter sp. MMG2]MBU8976504.1 hypothetical protein [Lysobacter sp. MMG2]